MKRIALTISLFFCISGYSFSQIYVSIDSDCLKRNSAIISKAMIEIFGKDSIRNLLEDNIQMIIMPQVDSLGFVLKIEKIRSKWSITNNFVTSLERSLITNRVRFYICYTKDPPNIQESIIIANVREYFKNNSSKGIVLGFPGELMSLYEYEKEKARKEGVCLSKYDYLLMQISSYL